MKATIIAAMLAITLAGSVNAQEQAGSAEAEITSECTSVALEPLLYAAIEAKANFDAAGKTPPTQRAGLASAAAELASAKADLAAALDQCGLLLPSPEAGIAPP